ncbi:MAG TPA: hypothetical protein VLA00_05570 [Xanthobacteraceae bacterium]|nr:hypothetical protein [Xanthobacteraceae bacterium]
MKHQYVGDVNDYGKYALLRALAAGGANRIGVCWMLTPDGGLDGGKLAYLGQPERYRHFDPDLFDLLKRASAEPDWRRLDTIEASGAIPSATYFNEQVPVGIEPRSAFFERARTALAQCDLVFFDPDTGLDVPSTPITRSDARKYVFLAEVANTYRAGKSVLVYQHFTQNMPRDQLVAQCGARLRDVAPGAAILAFRTPHVFFLLGLHPASPGSLHDAVTAAANRWSDKSHNVVRLHPDN